MIDRRQFLRFGAATAGAVVVGRSVPALAEGTGTLSHREPPAEIGADVPVAWFDLAWDLVRTTPGFTPPVAARAYGYAAVTLYEAVVPGLPTHCSLAGQLDGLRRRRHRTGEVHWPLVANAALAGAFRRLFPAGAPGGPAVDELEAELAASAGRRIDRHVARRSRRHGDATAAAIFAWSATDGGHEGYLRNFPADHEPPAGPGLWEPTPPGFLAALQPTWGANRTMVPDLVAHAPSAPPLPYSEDPTSPFFAEATEVYDTVNALTPEQREIALFWSDDPGLTATPPGHSVSILTQVLTAREASLALAAEAYARLGVALSDAFVCCWATKYEHNLLRPVTYIRAHIDPTWGDEPVLPLVTPPFPEHTSGHSVQSAAMATVLTELFGPMAFTDRTHCQRGLPARRFGSFYEAAAEAAISRLYGGIHFRRAIEEGLRQGAAVGDTVNRLTFSR